MGSVTKVLAYVAKLRRDNLLKDKNLHVCCKHFEETCFQIDLKVSCCFFLLLVCRQNMFLGTLFSLTLHFTLILRWSGYS